MLSVTAAYRIAVTHYDRTINSRITAGNLTLDVNDIIEWEIEQSCGNDGMPSVGGTPSAMCKLKLLKGFNITTSNIGQLLSNKVEVFTSLWVANAWVETKIGEFYVDHNSVVETEQTYEMDMYDVMSTYDDIKFGNFGAFPMLIEDMCVLLGTEYGVNINNNGGPSASNYYQNRPTGKSIRYILSEIGEILGASCVVNRNGAIDFRRPNKYVDGTFTAENCFTFAPNKEATKIAAMQVTGPNKEVNTHGNALDNEITIAFENDTMSTQAHVNSAASRFSIPYSYTGYTYTGQGMPHVDIYDLLTIKDTKNTSRNVVVCRHTLKFAGGLTSAFEANAPSQSGTISVGHTAQLGYNTGALKQSIDTLEASVATSIAKVGDVTVVGGSTIKLRPRGVADSANELTVSDLGYLMSTNGRNNGASSGYAILMNGFAICWGYVSFSGLVVGTMSNTRVTFPVTFAIAARMYGTALIMTTDPYNVHTSQYSPGTTSMNVTCTRTAGTGTSATVYWWAAGVIQGS